MHENIIFKNILTCFKCLINKVLCGKQQGLLHHIRSEKTPFIIVNLDHLRSFVKSSKEN